MISSSECLKSIYESTTFIFTDTMALQLFFARSCPFNNSREFADLDRESLIAPVPSRAFFMFTRKLELSLPAQYPLAIPCSTPLNRTDEQARDHYHDAHDLHWLQLHKFESLQDIKIWVSALGHVNGMSPEKLGPHRVINGLDKSAIQKMLDLPFRNVQSVTLSAPLSNQLVPSVHQDTAQGVAETTHETGSGDTVEDGYVDGLARPGIQVWKRGSGSRFYPLIPHGAGTLRTFSADQVDAIHAMIRVSEERFVLFPTRSCPNKWPSPAVGVFQSCKANQTLFKPPRHVFIDHVNYAASDSWCHATYHGDSQGVRTLEFY